jgi:soluble lytic murein transglycosylase-like protein
MPDRTPPPDLLALAHDAALAHALWPELVCAVIEQESSWNRWAVRYEPGFYKRYIEPQIARPSGDNVTRRAGAQRAVLSETEARARAFSWGLMQVMGQVAREHGFSGRSFAELCDPATGLEIGCRVFAAKLAAAEGNVVRALLLWNGGGNREYPDAVLARTHRYAAP